MGATSVIGVHPIDIDIASPKLKYEVSCNNASNTHTVYLASTDDRDGSTAFLTIATNKTFSVGETEHTYTFTAAQLQILYDYTKNTQSRLAYLHITTYNGGTSLGDYYAGGLVRTSADRSSPVIDDLLIEEYNYDVYAVTHGQYFVKGKSGIQVVPQHGGQGGAGGQYGATITGYTLTIGTQSVSSTNPVMVIDPVNSVATQATVTATDSRGYTSTFSKNITVLNYSAPSATSCTFTREYNSSITFASLTGKFSPLVYNGSAQNTIGRLRLYIRKRGTSDWSSVGYWELTETLTGTFSYNSPSGFALDTMTAYEAKLTGNDVFTAIDFGIYTIPRSGATVSYREGCIGINNRGPSSALDVNGIIQQNDYPVMGYVSSLAETASTILNLNDVTLDGIYKLPNGQHSYATTARNYPFDGVAGILEVFTAPRSTNIIQRFTPWNVSCICMRISYNSGSTWSAWVYTKTESIPR